MSYELPELPYTNSALEPHISAETLEYHHGKHHAAYVANLNKLVVGTEYDGKPLEDIITSSDGGIFNNAAQIWNHSFYWNCLSPSGGGAPSDELGKAIDETFGSFDAFQEKFTAAAIGNFGSGWTWLVKNSDESIEILNSSNAGSPLTSGQTPLITCDVWEHAYYIDYRNARPAYLEAFWNLVNWEFANKNYTG
jgi:superoxide dismutase, Fe-Mn family